MPKAKTSLKIVPLQDRVVIQAIEVADKTSGGLYIPDPAKERPQTGRLVAVGSGRFMENGERAPMELKTGQKVLYGKFAGTEITIDDESYLIIRESDVLAVVPE